MINAATFIEHLHSLGYSQYVGVPCSYLKPFINYVIDDPKLDYVGAASEGEAVGIALGAYLAGRKTVIMCQNSGLGNMVNPLTSLNYPFRVPALLIVTWRGQPGTPDEPQHEQMGRITQRLLDALEIPSELFPTGESEIAPILSRAEASMSRRSCPYALIMQQGTVAAHALTASRSIEPPTARTYAGSAVSMADRLTRTRALRTILGSLSGDEAVIATTGKTGRELFTIEDRPGHLYVVGGMGTAAAIGLGVAHASPAQPVVVIDGDGAVLMKMGCLATIGFHQPENLLHIILDNEQHDSTGGQQTASSVVRFSELGAASGYRQSYFATTQEDVSNCVAELRRSPGPSMLHVKIKPGSPGDLGRPTVRPDEVKNRFMEFLHTKIGAASIRAH